MASGEQSAAAVEVDLGAVIAAVTDEVPRIVTVRSARHDFEGDDEPLDTLPSGPLDAGGDRTLERAVRRWVRDQTGLELGYVEQLYTFGDRARAPEEHHTGKRVVTVAYLALVRQEHRGSTWPGAAGRWSDWYTFFPWEDWREGRPAVLERDIAPALAAWCAAAPTTAEQRVRRQRCDIAFGLEGVAWDDERVLERYELLYEADLVLERWRDERVAGVTRPRGDTPRFGRPMALDHRRILATALGRLRGKLKYRPVVFELLPQRFTLFDLQRLVEALSGGRLHKQNFRRLVVSGGLVEPTGELDRNTGGRPAELFEFRHEVLRERPAPGISVSGPR